MIRSFWTKSNLFIFCATHLWFEAIFALSSLLNAFFLPLSCVFSPAHCRSLQTFRMDISRYSISMVNMINDFYINLYRFVSGPVLDGILPWRWLVRPIFIIVHTCFMFYRQLVVRCTIGVFFLFCAVFRLSSLLCSICSVLLMLFAHITISFVVRPDHYPFWAACSATNRKYAYLSGSNDCTIFFRSRETSSSLIISMHKGEIHMQGVDVASQRKQMTFVLTQKKTTDNFVLPVQLRRLCL